MGIRWVVVAEQTAGCDWPSGGRGDLGGRPGLVSAAVRAAVAQRGRTGQEAEP